MRTDGLVDLVADGHDRIERRVRILEDHRDVAAAYRPERVRRQLRRFWPSIITDPDTFAVVRRSSPIAASQRDALAGARLADDTEGFAGIDVVGDVVDSVDEPVLRHEVDRQVADLEDLPCSGRTDLRGVGPDGRQLDRRHSSQPTHRSREPLGRGTH